MVGVTLADDLRKTVGDKTAKVLKSKWDMATVGDLLRHYPRRYVRHGELTDLASLTEGEDVTVVGRVVDSRQRKITKRPFQLLEVTVEDATGRRISLTFFGTGVHKAAADLQSGVLAMIAGRVGLYRGKVQLTHPDYEVIPGRATAETVEEYAARPIPIYPATKDLPSWKIKKAVEYALGPGLDLADPMPASVLGRRGLVPLGAALEGIHRPKDDDELRAARKRLKWDEAFYVQLALALRREAAADLPATPRPDRADGLRAAFDAALPFTLTDGQVEVGAEISADLARAHPMHRLLQGDVGAGKTVVALRAMLQVVDNGGQAALLAPTEVLAQQHYRSILSLLGPLARAGQLDGVEGATRVALLTGSQGAKAKRAALLEAASGGAGIVVGTHALIQEHVQFADLGLIVVDEQHRFGVEQRDALREKVAGGRPHVLVMTATPIPRTVAMTVFGDLDTSVLAQLPAGRAAVATHVVPPEKPAFLARAWQRIREEAAEGRQAYIVCPRIGDDAGGRAGEEEDLPREEGEARPPLAVMELLPLLEGELLRGLRIDVLHGRMHPDDKDAAMRRFAAGETDVLLATTVVEVGVDVPNATVMMIMDADRFGVSQLHQLRGRVGRGGLPGLCLLVTDVPADAPARARLEAVASTSDGFELSRLDLEQRREGDILGAAQSGTRSTLRLLTLQYDEPVISNARKEASRLLAEDPGLAGHPEVRAALEEFLTEDRADYLDKA
ncbi:ATP-dependent DNA helicase RecG [Actinocorallia sp. API 0066]|uniref:ATP-dependent DNA helicase RecG n=1 Tax=Actinocorallia sp. API 0066 TaxID=2896846 RepID=UPI001E560927|nr:ATP-dependent DNA helicase RecG [Actinocorallia sp. API 0066]MCD0448373.1 ATP-dependent DNA helicase RecG [Actinocorallia sp. API 0066]